MKRLSTLKRQSKKKSNQKRRKKTLLITAVLLPVIEAVVLVFVLMLYYSPDHQSASPGSVVVKSAPPKTSAEVATPTPVPVSPTPVTVKPDVLIPPVVNGVAPVISRIDTKEPVVFLGIDDGGNKQPFELQMMKDNGVKASLFLADLFIRNDPGFFKDFIPAGSLIEDHSVDHILFPRLSYAQQKQQICDQADKELQEYGRRPILFRPPGGAYDANTPRAAAACGMKAVVQWIAKANGGSMQYQIGHGLRAGDIVLMHFRPEFKSDMQAFLDAEKAAGLHTELLEDWLPAS